MILLTNVRTIRRRPCWANRTQILLRPDASGSPARRTLQVQLRGLSGFPIVLADDALPAVRS